MKVLVLSSSLHPASRSRALARRVASDVADAGAEVEFIDHRDHPLPFCDGKSAYGDPNLPALSDAIGRADAILAASPVYNYDVGSNLKNLVELTGQKWREKIVGFVLAAGGEGSYMSVMAFAASLMLDFHCLILPHFVYATGDAFDGDTLVDGDVTERLAALAQETVRIAGALAG
jgi:FMN reductase